MAPGGFPATTAVNKREEDDVEGECQRRPEGDREAGMMTREEDKPTNNVDGARADGLNGETSRSLLGLSQRDQKEVIRWCRDTPNGWIGSFACIV
jgi:hypothetical protein